MEYFVTQATKETSRTPYRELSVNICALLMEPVEECITPKTDEKGCLRVYTVHKAVTACQPPVL